MSTQTEAAPIEYDDIARGLSAEMSRARKSQTAVARAMGENQQWLSRRLSGKVEFRITEVLQICELIGIDFADFLAMLPRHENRKPTLSKRHGLYLVRPVFNGFSGLRNAS